MRARIVSVLRSVAAALSLLGFVVAFALARSASASPRIVLASASAGAIALGIAAGPRALLALFGVGVDRGDGAGGGRDDEPEWWLAGFEPTVEDVWDREADYALAAGLAVVGVGALAVLATDPGDDPPMHLLLLGLLGVNGALIVLAGAAISE